MILESSNCWEIWTWFANEEVKLRSWVCTWRQEWERRMGSTFSEHTVLASLHHTSHIFPRLYLFTSLFCTCILSLNNLNADLFLTYIFGKQDVSKYFEDKNLIWKFIPKQRNNRNKKELLNIIKRQNIKVYLKKISSAQC